MNRLILLVICSMLLVACSNHSVYSGSVYTSEQAKQIQKIEYGEIVSSRSVIIQARTYSQGVVGTVGGGAVGAILGGGIGGGTGRALATAVGSVVGAVVGNKIEEKFDQVDSLELVIRKDSGEEIVVVQKAEESLVVGARVRIVIGKSVNVSAL